MSTKPRKPSKYQSAYTQQLKELQRIVKKARTKGIELSPSFTPKQPKRITPQSIRKVERLSMRATEIVESTIHKQRTGAKQDLTRRPRGIAQTYIPKGENLLARKLAAQKAAQTRKEREARMSAEKREALRQKRAAQFAKSMAKVDRKLTAQKAAATRKAREAQLSETERQALKKKRAEQFRRNLQKYTTEQERDFENERRKSKGEEEARRIREQIEDEAQQATDINTQEGEKIYERVLEDIRTLDQEFFNSAQAEYHRQNATILEDRLNEAIEERGFEEVMRSIAAQADLFIKAAEAIIYASSEEAVSWGLSDVITIITGRPLSALDSETIAELKEGLSFAQDIDRSGKIKQEAKLTQLKRDIDSSGRRLAEALNDDILY